MHGKFNQSFVYGKRAFRVFVGSKTVVDDTFCSCVAFDSLTFDIRTKFSDCALSLYSLLIVFGIMVFCFWSSSQISFAY